MTGHTQGDIKEAQEWLRRAHTNAKAAKLLVGQEDPELLVEAVTQVQQACEKATKAILLAHGTAYRKVTAMGHNIIGAFVSLIAGMLEQSPLAEDVSQAVLKPNAMEYAKRLTKVTLNGRRNKSKREKVLLAFKQILPEGYETLGTQALEVEEWERLTRAFPPKVVEIFVDFQEYHSDLWHRYISEIHNVHVDPRPLLSGGVPAETWVFSEDHAALPRQFPGQESDTPINSVLTSLAQQMVNDVVKQRFGHLSSEQFPESVNVIGLVRHISNWLTSLSWLFLCATVTTPHAVSSRYPAERTESETAKGSQHYNRGLGVVACIGPLAAHTDQVIRNLMEHYRQIGSGYSRMVQ